MGAGAVVGQVWGLRSLIIVFGVILAALPIIFCIPDGEMPEEAKRCLYCLVVMAVVWLTEALPISATALFPIVLFPLCGVMKASATSAAYINDTSMLFFGGLVVAVAVEECKLHKRIAMLVMMLVGSDPKWVMAGMMLPTWFLSMWISNTATASMMIPIAQAVMDQIRDTKKGASHPHPQFVEGPDGVTIHLPEEEVTNGNINQSFEGDEATKTEQNGNKFTGNTTELTPVMVGSKKKVYVIGQPESEVPEDDVEHDPRFERLCKGMTLCIAYGANIGGIATLTGTAPNLVLKGIADGYYRDASTQANASMAMDSPISFSNWMLFALPLSAIVLILGWLLLVVMFISGKGCCTKNKEEGAAIRSVIKSEYKSLGRVTMAEIMVSILFVILAVLWISRDPKESPGWTVAFKNGYVSDSTAAMLIAVLLFVLPGKVPNVFCWATSERSQEPYYTPLLTWEQVHRKLPWGVIILLGGGFALAEAVQVSCLADWLSVKLQGLQSLDTWVLNLVLCLIVACATEVTSNTATATLLMPILANLAISLQVNPLYFMVSSAVATSFAFMLPVATPPNAIVFSYGRIHVHDMAKAGLFMNIIAVAVLTLAVNTWGKEVYDFDTLDPIFLTAASQNVTRCVPGK